MEFVERLRKWADMLAGSVGTYDNRFLNNFVMKYTIPLVSLGLVILTILIVFVTASDIMYITLPIYRIFLNKILSKVNVRYGNLSNGTAGYLATKTPRVKAARIAEVDGVSAGLLYYLKTRVVGFVIVGTLWGIFLGGTSFNNLFAKLGAGVQNAYINYYTYTTGLQVKYQGDDIRNDYLHIEIKDEGNGQGINNSGNYSPVENSKGNKQTGVENNSDIDELE